MALAYYYNQMYVKHYFTFLLALASTSSVPAQNSIKHALDTRWELSRFGIDETFPATVPGNVHTDLMKAGVIPDPFLGTNEDSVQWVGLEDWTYKTSSFSVPSDILSKENVKLIFRGLDTYANVWLNEQHILSANNYHRSWEVDVKGILKSSDNTLQVNFKSASKIGEILASETDYVLPGEEFRAVTRKPQFHYGWDWGPKLIGCGIHAPIDIVGFDNLRLVSQEVVVLDHVSDHIPLRFVFKVSAEQKWSGQYKITLNDSTTFIGKAKLKPGQNTIAHVFKKFPKAGLWWPKGKGDQTFNKVKFQLHQAGKVALTKEKKVGIRRVDLVTEKDSHGETFFFSINDEAIFCKGANYIPIDFFQNRVTKEDYDRVIGDVIDANMNMVRVWGGGIYESDYFYNLCDSLGVMVWQDFMYACAMYPHQKYFLENAQLEAEEQLERLAGHPSIVLWCGNNEISEGWERWGWQTGLKATQKKEVAIGYKKLFKKILPKAVRNYSAIPYWESSPLLGRGDPEHQFRGDAHYWGVWHDAQPFDTLNYVVPRFMSEFGFQSFPEWRTILSYTSESKPVRSNPAVVSHEKHSRGFDLIDEYMNRDYGYIPDSFEDYVWLGQIQQAEGIGLGLDAHRRNAPYCMGTLYWQLNDCWPVASWSSVDFFGRWKPLHFEAKTQFEPQKLSHFLDGDQLSIYLISDEKLIPGTEARWRFDLTEFDGNIQDSLSGLKSIRNDLSQLIWQGSIAHWKSQGRSTFINAQVQFGDEKLNLTIDLAKPKDQQLAAAQVEVNSRQMRSGDIELSFLASNYIRNLWIEQNIDGHFSDNNFDLMPGELRVVMFTPNRKSTVLPAFTFRTLNDILAD